MTSPSPTPNGLSRPALPYAAPNDAARLTAAVFLGDAAGALLVAAGILFVGLVAVLDHHTACRFSFSLFYLIPAAACAWWGGFPCGLFLALAATAAWHAVDSFRDPTTPLPVLTFNGVVRFCTLTLVASLVSRLHAGIRREHLLARTDPLTGAANGRTFYSVAAAEADRARRWSRPLTVAYFDLDNFKQLNDRWGHAAGDAALRQVVELARLNLRKSDLVARLGGDEFALLLPETGPEGALTVLARLRDLLALEMSLRGWPVTLSIGAVTFHRPPADVDLMVQRVDALMYQAKRNGKNRVEHAVAEDQRPAHGEAGRVERRATAQVLEPRAAKVRPEGQQGGPEEFATVRDLSAARISLQLERRFSDDTLLLVEPFSPGAKTLLARVVQAAPDEGGWRHGCELSTRLSDEEIRRWLGEHFDPARSPQAASS